MLVSPSGDEIPRAGRDIGNPCVLQRRDRLCLCIEQARAQALLPIADDEETPVIGEVPLSEREPPIRREVRGDAGDRESVQDLARGRYSHRVHGLGVVDLHHSQEIARTGEARRLDDADLRIDVPLTPLF